MAIGKKEYQEGSEHYGHVIILITKCKWNITLKNVINYIYILRILVFFQYIYFSILSMPVNPQHTGQLLGAGSVYCGFTYTASTRLVRQLVQPKCPEYLMVSCNRNDRHQCEDEVLRTKVKTVSLVSGSQKPLLGLQRSATSHSYPTIWEADARRGKFKNNEPLL